MIPSANTILHRCIVQWPRPFSDGNELIRSAIESGQPRMVARFGSTEIQATVYPRLPGPLRRVVRHRCMNHLYRNAGVFPPGEATLLKFAKFMLEEAESIDILASWRIEEALLSRHLTRATFVPLRSIEPYYFGDPWTGSLAGRRVLVVHPFKKTIERQYALNRSRLFRDSRVLPEFASLTVLEAVQSIAGAPTPYADWFEALESMRKEVDRIDFDVAIIGCGAYGLPLAAHVKQKGRIGIHMGGATQLLFGIKGRRWDNHPVISGLINEYWVRPASEETPATAAVVEKACYW